MQNIRTRLVVKFICQVMDIPYVGRFLAIPFVVFLFAWDFCHTKATTFWLAWSRKYIPCKRREERRRDRL